MHAALCHAVLCWAQVYVVYFKTNRRAIHEYPNLANYVRDLYQTPGGESENRIRFLLARIQIPDGAGPPGAGEAPSKGRPRELWPWLSPCAAAAAGRHAWASCFLHD